jgi:general secretion pathway protein A
MYETYYGFSRPPFGLTPDVRFCYQHRSYTRAKAYMQYAVMREEGFLVVTGRPGMGKTTLIQDLLAELGGEDRLVARIDSTQLDADELLRLVTYAFGLPARGLDKATLLHGLEEFLRRRAGGSGTAILIVDEAQNLPDRSLEELRLITNLQQGARALIQIFLVGQESLRDLIHQHHLEQLQQRIVAACHLEPLDLTETRAYIRHRLQCAGWSGDPAFDADALRLIYQASGGVPRLINKICDRLLLYGSVDELHVLKGAESRLVIEDLAAELSELPDGGLQGIASMDPGTRQVAIEDLIEEPGAGPMGAHSGGEAGAPADPGYLGTPPSAGSNADKGGTGEQYARPAEAPSTPDDRARLDTAGDTVAEAAVARETPRPPDFQDEAVAAADPRVTSWDPAAPSLSAARERVDRADRAGGHDGTGRRWRRRLLPYAATGAMLLGVGSLLLALQGKTPDEVAARVGALADRVAQGLESLAGRAGIALSPPGSDPVGSGQAASAAASQFPAPSEQDPVGPVGGVDGGGEAGDPGGRPTVHDPRDAAEPIDALETLKPGRGEAGGPVALMHSDAGSSAPEGPVPGGGSPTPAADPALPDSYRWGHSDGDGAGPDGLADPIPLGDVQGPSPIAAETSSPEAQAHAGGIPSLEEELRRLGHRVRDLGDGRLSFDLADEVPFASDSARLPDGIGEVLNPLAAVLVRNPEVRITLVGHTDSRGPADYNRRLSLSRARAVADYLGRRGVPEQRLASQGMGKEAPLPEEESVARRRRIEVVIQPAPR